MTRDALIAALEQLTSGDPDGTKHAYALGLLMGFFTMEGYDDVVQAYLRARDRVPFGYV